MSDKEVPKKAVKKELPPYSGSNPNYNNRRGQPRYAPAPAPTRELRSVSSRDSVGATPAPLQSPAPGFIPSATSSVAGPINFTFVPSTIDTFSNNNDKNNKKKVKKAKKNNTMAASNCRYSW